MTDPHRELGTLIAEDHLADDADPGPVQMISVALLEHYRRCEAELAELKRRAAVSYVLPAR